MPESLSARPSISQYVYNFLGIKKRIENVDTCVHRHAVPYGGGGVCV